MSVSTDPRLSQRPTWATFTRGIQPHRPNSSMTWQQGSKGGENGTPGTQNARGAEGPPSQSNTSHKRQPRQQTPITKPPSLTHANAHGYRNQRPLPTTLSRPTPSDQSCGPSSQHGAEGRGRDVVATMIRGGQAWFSRDGHRWHPSGTRQLQTPAYDSLQTLDLRAIAGGRRLERQGHRPVVIQRLQQDDLMTLRRHLAATAEDRLPEQGLVPSKRHHTLAAGQAQQAQPMTTTASTMEAAPDDMNGAQHVTRSHDAGDAQQMPSPAQQAPAAVFVATTTTLPVAIWEFIIDLLLEVRPGNGWDITRNRTVHSLEGDTARSLLTCRATCTAFDHHTLRQFSQFIMRPIEYRRDPALFEIEFEQREFCVCGTPNGVLYSEFRTYSPELLKMRRDLIRTNQVHDAKERLPRDSPDVQFWVALNTASRAPGPDGESPSPWLLARQSLPWFLSHRNRDAIHERRLRAAWTPERYAEFFTEADNAIQPASPGQSSDSA